MNTVFSSPGKALLAGGYLVLDPDYEAFVVALSARMHAAVTSLKTLGEDDITKITVNSPQFKQGVWAYSLDITRLPDLNITEENGRKNPFVKSTILTVLSYLKPSTNYEISITIFSDSGYHTQADSIPKASTNGKRTFHYHNIPINQVPKTGLGSSAGLVTSLTAALLVCYKGPDFFKKSASENAKTLNCLHNLSQVAHSIAQGKVGSGFDVASAVYGSIVYRRFQPDLINKLLDLEMSQFAKGLQKLIDNTDWKIEHKQCCMVPGIHIIMGDVAGGSETPKLVSKVMKWRKENTQRALAVWTELNDSNMRLVKSLEDLQTASETDKVGYAKLLAYLNTHSASEIDAEGSEKLLVDVVESVKNIRKWLKVMTVESGAEIEPDEQTKLLNSCLELNGCLGGVVPGAGGYDAICLMVAEDSIVKIMQSTKNDPNFKHVKWLRLAEQKQGLMREDPEDFKNSDTPVTASHQYFDTQKKQPENSLLTKYRSLLITPLSNTKQKIIDAASDNFSIKSFRSRKSINRVSILDLPDEVILQVFQNLRQDAHQITSLVCLLYVSKKFNELAKRILYEDPYITTTFRLSQFVQTININKQLALLVRKIDFSRIQIGIELKEDEWDQFATNIVFGSCGGQYDDLLMANGERRILAGWRDFKYRFNPLYSGVGNTLPSSTSFVPPHVIPDEFSRNPIYSPSMNHHGCNPKSLWSTTSLLSSQSSRQGSSCDSVNSLFSMYNYQDSEGFGTIGGGHRHSFPARHSSMITNTTVNEDTDDDSFDEEGYEDGENGVDDDFKLNPSSHKTGPIEYFYPNSYGIIAQPGFFNSMKTVWNAAMIRISDSCRSDTKPINHHHYRKRRHWNKAKQSGIRQRLFQSRKDISRPFSTLHPQQNEFFKQYCFARDIPIGYILHIMEECENLTEINLSGISWSVDFKLDDYEYFDWEVSRGKVRCLRGTVPSNHEYRSMLLVVDQAEVKRKEQQLAKYKMNKPIYWSDTVREIDFRDPELHSLTINSIWPYIMKLEHLQILRLRSSVWIDKHTVRDILVQSKSRKILKIIDCTNSGLARNSDWATSRTAKEWRQFFRKDNTF
ncbi:hypothetical protein FOA43_000901 [Brettanomyces nanus]|uniref:phosphomevalonate kinase n=1 Tax=Eeniella nana TaxID=13502 RepID=A0A875S156_EENNA|nr:uncharacterized protein FOA43_000901 [Brettanomyces nanus]QPG73589.1 hypothetical protein FOA43_000901 [Brettanomyces nanus]